MTSMCRRNSFFSLLAGVVFVTAIFVGKAEAKLKFVVDDGGGGGGGGVTYYTCTDRAKTVIVKGSVKDDDPRTSPSRAPIAGTLVKFKSFSQPTPPTKVQTTACTTPGIPSITVYDGVYTATATTDANGNYSIALLAELPGDSRKVQYEIELTAPNKIKMAGPDRLESPSPSTTTAKDVKADFEMHKYELLTETEAPPLPPEGGSGGGKGDITIESMSSAPAAAESTASIVEFKGFAEDAFTHAFLPDYYIIAEPVFNPDFINGVLDAEGEDDDNVIGPRRQFTLTVSNGISYHISITKAGYDPSGVNPDGTTTHVDGVTDANDITIDDSDGDGIFLQNYSLNRTNQLPTLALIPDPLSNKNEADNISFTVTAADADSDRGEVVYIEKIISPNCGWLTPASDIGSGTGTETVTYNMTVPYTAVTHPAVSENCALTFRVRNVPAGDIKREIFPTFTVADVNRAPTVSLDPPDADNLIQVGQGNLFSLIVRTTDPDAEDALSLTWLSTTTPGPEPACPSWLNGGVCSGSGVNPRTIAGTVPVAAALQDRLLNFEGSDGIGAPVPYSFTLSVVDVAHLPMISNPLPASSPVDIVEGASQNFSADATDEDITDTLRCEWRLTRNSVTTLVQSSGPGGPTGTISCAYTYAPLLGDAAAYALELKVLDQDSNSATHPWNGTVTKDERSPTLTMNQTPNPAKEGEGEVVITLTGTDLNPQDAVTLTVGTKPAWLACVPVGCTITGALNAPATMQLRGHPHFDVAGVTANLQFQVTPSDGNPPAETVQTLSAVVNDGTILFVDQNRTTSPPIGYEGMRLYPYVTINGAIQHTNTTFGVSADTINEIRVLPGLYEERVWINRAGPLLIKSESGSEVTTIGASFDLVGQLEVVHADGIAKGGLVGFTVDARYEVGDGLRLSNTAMNTAGGDYFDVKNNIFRRSGSAGIEVGFYNATAGNTSAKANIRNNLITESDGNGINISGASSTPVTVVNNIVLGNKGRMVSNTTGGAPAPTANYNTGFQNTVTTLPTGTGNVNRDPLLVGSGDYHLLAGSPEIGSGDLSQDRGPYGGPDAITTLVARAGLDTAANLNEGPVSILDGSKSSHANGLAAPYSWVVTGAGTLSGSGPKPLFTAPASAESDTVTLTVGGSATDTAVITVRAPIDWIVAKTGTNPATGSCHAVPVSLYRGVQRAVDCAGRIDRVLVRGGAGPYDLDTSASDGVPVIMKEGVVLQGETRLLGRGANVGIWGDGNYSGVLRPILIRAFDLTSGGIDGLTVYGKTTTSALRDAHHGIYLSNVKNYKLNYLLVSGHSRTGIMLGHSDNVQIKNNLVYANSKSSGAALLGSATGIFVIKSSADVENNAVDLTTRGGIEIYSVRAGTDVRNNIVTNNGFGISKSGFTTTPASVAYNDVWNNLYCEITPCPTNPFVERNYMGFSASDPNDANGDEIPDLDIQANPLFVNPVDYTNDPGGLDYRLNIGSPAIDAGDPAIFDSWDSSRSDMGVFGGPGAIGMP